MALGIGRGLPALAAVVFSASLVDAATHEVGPSDDVEAVLDDLQPGDEVVLADGTYTLTERFSFSALGTEAAPIVIRAAEGARPHFHRPDASQNIWDVEDARHVVIRGLGFSGGSAGLRIMRATNLTIEECEIFETGDVALRMNDAGVTYERVQILRNHIHHTFGTGEGMYLGCNDDGCRLAFGRIEGNHVHHTNAPEVRQGDGIELKDGSYGTVIRDNVIHDTKYPCLLGYSTAGNGPPNVVERNVMWGCGDHGIQWEADATIANNVVLGAAGAALATQPHQESGPSNLTIVHNTLINDGDALTIRQPSGPVTVANNALYSMTRAIFLNGDAARVTAEGNAGSGSVQGIEHDLIAGGVAMDFVAASFSGVLPQDVFPTATGVLPAGGAAHHVVGEDFNGSDRRGVADIGAYALGTGTNPGWTIAAESKAVSDGGNSGADAGPPGGADGGVGTPDSRSREDVGDPAPAADASAGADGRSPSASDADAASDGAAGPSCQAVSCPPGAAMLSLGLAVVLSLRSRRGRSRRSATEHPS